VVRAAGPWILTHCRLPPLEWLDVVADESAEEVRAHQPILEQPLEDVAHGLELAGIFLSHPVPPARLNGGALTRNHKEQCFNIVPQEEPLFPPSN
jgi:hypothetical protein